jgi:multidrug efflux pump subunit AcrB
MDWLTRFSMKNISAVFIIMLILFAGGFYSSTQLKVENMPDISFPIVIVQTAYQAAPQDVMENVTEPLEEKLKNIEDLDTITSMSTDNYSIVFLQFEQDADAKEKKQEVQDLVAEVTLPSSAGTPRVMTYGFADMPTNYLVLHAAEGMSQTELDRLFHDRLKEDLEKMDGFDHMDVVGARQTTLSIELNADALNVYGLSPQLVSGAIQAAVSKSPIGSVELDGNEKMARVTGDVVTLAQIAKVKAISESDFVSRMNGKPAISVILYKANSANAVDFSNKLQALIDKWKQETPELEVSSFYDSADDVKNSINGLIREGIAGALLASLMILLFLRNGRMTLIVLVSLPLSVLITLIAMKVFGLTVNAMSLGGMFIAIGRVVDDAIVVIESIYAQLERAQERGESVIRYATKQVSMAITASTLATSGVFLPIALVSGIISKFFVPFSITIVCALLASLLVAVTVIPMLAKLLVLRSRIKPYDENKKGTIKTLYSSILSWCLNHRLVTLLITAVLFVGTIIGTTPFLKVSFLPGSTAPETMYFQIKMPYETSFEAADLKLKQIENMLLESKDQSGEPLFSMVQGLVGFQGDDERPKPYAAQIYLRVNKKFDPDVIKAQTKEFLLAELPPGSEAEVFSIGGDMEAFIEDFTYQLAGENQSQLEKAAAMVKEELKRFPQITEVEDTLSDAETEVEITVDRDKARRFGLSVPAVMQTAAIWIQEQNLGDIRLDGEMYETTVSMDKSAKNSLEALGNIPLVAADGSIVYLKEVADVYEKMSSSSLTRENGQQVVTITATINDPDKNRISRMVASELMKLELPEGVTPKAGGVTEEINDSFSQLYVAMAAAVAVVYLIMVISFGNAMAPFAILFSLPLAVIGGLIALVITGETLDVTSMIGFLMLIGIVVTNAIVLIDRTQQLREEGYTVRQALMEAGLIRLRPILMTAGATIMALIPLAMGISGEGVLIGKSLGVVVIGGLTTSTLLTLVIVPIVYELLESLKERVLRRKSRKKPGVGAGQAALEG